MFIGEQLRLIYYFFPKKYYDETEKIWYERCHNCFIEIVEHKNLCFNCSCKKFSELTIIEKLLIKIYRKWGLSELKRAKEILDPHNKIKNIYDKCIIHILHKPQKLKELLDEGADPDMNFGQITGNEEYTLLGWCMKEHEEIAIDMFVKASKNGKIFINRNKWNLTVLGSNILNLLSNEFSDQYYRDNIQKLINLGSKIENETLNTCAIHNFQYEDKPNRQNNIIWLLNLGIKYDLNRCTVFGCKSFEMKERCVCGTKKLKETRLGKFLIQHQLFTNKYGKQ